MGTGIIVSTTAILELCERKVRDIHTAPEQECVATSPAPAAPGERPAGVPDDPRGVGQGDPRLGPDAQAGV